MRRSVLTTVFLLLACCGREAFACECPPPPGESTRVWHKDRLKSYLSDAKFASDTIFLGTVTKIEEESGSEHDSGGRLKVAFAVERIWAFRRANSEDGEAAITVRTREFEGMCGFAFKEGGRYFVFAKHGETSICTPTTRYYDDLAEDYYKALGEGKKPAKHDPVKPEPLVQKPPR